METLLQLDHPLRFACGPELPCFGVCCSDLDLVLTPHDALRLQRRLGLSADQFLVRHTERQLRGPAGLPFLFLRMRDDDNKSCPFLTPQGCSVYSDRPLACRLYPLGLLPPAPELDPAAQTSQSFGAGRTRDLVGATGRSPLPLDRSARSRLDPEGFLLIRESHCQGHQANRRWTVREWLSDQCPGEELERGRQFNRLCLHRMRTEF